MHAWEEFLALFLVWLGLVAVVGVYVVRIAILVREQRLVERVYRLRLARSLGETVRDASAGGSR